MLFQFNSIQFNSIQFKRSGLWKHYGMNWDNPTQPSLIQSSYECILMLAILLWLICCQFWFGVFNHFFGSIVHSIIWWSKYPNIEFKPLPLSVDHVVLYNCILWCNFDYCMIVGYHKLKPNLNRANPHDWKIQETSMFVTNHPLEWILMKTNHHPLTKLTL